jgi:ParB family chromosome partitioning protein
MTAETRKPDDTRHRGLGRGLSALIGDEAAPGARRQQPQRPPGAGRVPASEPLPAAQDFVPEELHDLANSIREKGVLQPILVRPVAGDANAFEIVAGERRWRAAQLAKLHDVPVVVREMNDGEALELAIIENVQRSDLNAIEEAAAYRELMDRFAYTQERCPRKSARAAAMSRTRCGCSNCRRPCKAMIRDGQAHGRPRAHPDRARRSRGAGEGDHRRRAQCSPGRTPFGF